MFRMLMASLLASLTFGTALVQAAVPKTPIAWEQLQGWQADTLSDALPAWQHICARWQRLPKDTPIAKPTAAVKAGTVADWLPACLSTPAPGADAAVHRQWWESHFTPWQIGGPVPGLFTGYYQKQLLGSETRGGVYQYPLYGRPADLVRVENKAFGLPPGEHWGRITPEGTVIPYHDRAAIEQGQLPRDTPVLYWLADPVAAFFLHIQGSGIITLPDGQTRAVGFAARNGQPYTAIGALLIKRGELPAHNTNLNSIRTWLYTHPDKGAALMQENKSFIFFKKREDSAAVGAMGLPLTARRSLAVDPSVLPYGVPLWLEVDSSGRFPVSFQTLVFAMDTGAAIRGVVRGDFFWGSDKAAEDNAGPMANPGRYRILLPKNVRP